jgi:3-hydroxyisobutyrate dehydrogenase
MATRVAVLGLGLMGAGMSRNLLAAGMEVSVYNRSPERSAPLGEAGARVALTPREAAEGAHVIISMVADDNATRSVWMGPDGALAGAPAGAILVESSTTTVDWVRELAAAAKVGGFDLLDAPVTGSKVQAEAGELLFLVGGDAEVLERARPVLTAMSREIVHIGPGGSGALMKLVNNFLCGVQAASLGEAMAFIEKGGLDREKAVDVLLQGAPGSPLVKLLSGRMMRNDFTPNFALRLMMKDLTYAAAEGARNGVQLRTAEAARQVFETAVEAGFGEDDMSAVVRPFRG